MSTKCIRTRADEVFWYAFAVCRLMYAQICTRPTIGLTVGLLGRWRAANKVLRYTQGTKNYNLT
jgi:hypothetical protein